MTAVTAAILRRADGCVLVCRRASGGCAGLWEFPGGKQEPGETLRACMERELREELAIETRAGAVYDAFVFDTPGRQLAFTFFEVQLCGGTPRCTVHSALRWLPPKQLRAEEFCPADRRVVKKLQEEAL